jgi:GAF domain
MLLMLSDKVNECLARAADVRGQAEATTNPRWKAHLLDMESRWLRLAERFRFIEQADRFLEDARGWRPSAETWAQSGCPTVGREPNDAVKVAADRLALSKYLDDLIRIATERADGGARAAFYIADAKQTQLHHVTGMPPAYARHVDGFAIGTDSLACGLAASMRQAVITPDVTEEPRWKPWLWLANEGGYRACWSFPIETSAAKIVGTFAMYYKEPREGDTARPRSRRCSNPGGSDYYLTKLRFDMMGRAIGRLPS